MRAFKNIVIGWVHQMLVGAALSYCFKPLKIPQEQESSRLKLYLRMSYRMSENFTILNSVSPLNVVDWNHFLDIRSQFPSHKSPQQSLVELAEPPTCWVSETGDFHTISQTSQPQPAEPVDGFPVILNKADVVLPAS